MWPKISPEKRLFHTNFFRTKKLDKHQSAEELDIDYIFEYNEEYIDNELLSFMVLHGVCLGTLMLYLSDKQKLFLVESGAISETDAVQAGYSAEKMIYLEMHKRIDHERLMVHLKQKQLYDDFVEKCIRTKKFNEYQSDEKLDFEYIFKNYWKDIDDEQLLYFVNRRMINFNILCSKLTNRQIIFLLENDALSEEDALNNFMGYDVWDRREKLIDYFLEKNFAIRPEWIAYFIENDSLIERIKEKHNFKFCKIFKKSGYKNPFRFPGQSIKDERKKFYNAVHKHFPDPNFKTFKRIYTEHVDDYAHRRYYYDKDKDKLLIIGDSELTRDHEFSLGHCKDLIENENNLPDLIEEYFQAIQKYTAYIKRRSEIWQIYLDREEDHRVFDEFFCELYPIPFWPDVVAHLYFVISQKPYTTAHKLEYLAMQTIAKRKIDFNHLPPLLKQKMAKMNLINEGKRET